MEKVYLEPWSSKGTDRALRVVLEDGTVIPNVTDIAMSMSGDKRGRIVIAIDNVVLRNKTAKPKTR